MRARYRTLSNHAPPDCVRTLHLRGPRILSSVGHLESVVSARTRGQALHEAWERLERPWNTYAESRSLS